MEGLACGAHNRLPSHLPWIPLNCSSPEPVRSLEDALRVVCRWSSTKQQADRGILAALGALQQQPTALGLTKLLAAVDGNDDALAAAGNAAGQGSV